LFSSNVEPFETSSYQFEQFSSIVD